MGDIASAIYEEQRRKAPGDSTQQDAALAALKELRRISGIISRNPFALSLHRLRGIVTSFTDITSPDEWEQPC